MIDKIDTILIFLLGECDKNSLQSLESVFMSCLSQRGTYESLCVTVFQPVKVVPVWLWEPDPVNILGAPLS